MDTLKIGWATVELGCGQKSKLTQLDATGGIEFIRKVGDEVRKGDPVFRCFNSNKSKLDSAIELLGDSEALIASVILPAKQEEPEEAVSEDGEEGDAPSDAPTEEAPSTDSDTGDSE